VLKCSLLKVVESLFSVGHGLTTLAGVPVVIANHLVEERSFLKTLDVLVPVALLDSRNNVLCQDFDNVGAVFVQSLLKYCLVLRDCLVLLSLFVLLLDGHNSAPGCPSGRHKILKCD
jgi:hypothetical protein